MSKKRPPKHQCPTCKYSTIGLIPDDRNSITCPECGDYHNPNEPNPTYPNHNAPNKKYILMLYIITIIVFIVSFIFFCQIMILGANSISESVS